ncbi:cytochrome P450 [Pseudoalteromonas sp. T1lg75]|uniref:cytochrome P450 n=1 Tax=Pseudoalteromonas sp. T1lg75 TaxID=2077102 RepID=UPI000CF747DF|nr:cytochrome P450 [Pseudoalteromonas sp. T1lg75]
MKFEPSDELYQDPFSFLDKGMEANSDVIEFPNNEKYLVDVEDAKRVLANKEGHYVEHSDFFFTRNGYFGPRSVQIAISKGAIKLLHNIADKQQPQLKELIATFLAGTRQWPNSGNRFFYELFKFALLKESCAERLHICLKEIVDKSVLAGVKQNRSLLRRLLFRRKAMKLLKREIRQRRQHDAATKEDILDCIIFECDPEVSNSEIADIFLSFVFAITGSLGFTLGWSLYEIGKSDVKDKRDIEPEWAVKEALRLWPVAWNLTRIPSKPHTLSEAEFKPGDAVVACPYTAHRSERNFENATQFNPQRWENRELNNRFIAFGWGEHKCIAANLAISINTKIIRSLLSNYSLEFIISEQRPLAEAALAPPPFTLIAK